MTALGSLALSWRLKVARAKKHLAELEEQVRLYSDSHPYEVRWKREPNSQPRAWRAILSFTRQPDPDISIIIGDVIHNLRSSLDHLATALVPSKRTQINFPISEFDLLATNPDGSFVHSDEERRQRYVKAIGGMRPEARAIVQRLQPYSEWSIGNGRLRLATMTPDSNRAVDSPHPENHVLAILNRLDNADKHRRLIAIAAHFPSGSLVLRDIPDDVVSTHPFDGPRADHTEILRVRDLNGKWRGDLPDAEVKVQLNRPLQILVDVGKPFLGCDVVHTLGGILLNIETDVFTPLEPYVYV